MIKLIGFLTYNLGKKIYWIRIGRVKIEWIAKVRGEK
jgi:hypothetical protein